MYFVARLISILILWTCFAGHFCLTQTYYISTRVINPSENKLKSTFKIMQEGNDVSNRVSGYRDVQVKGKENCSFGKSLWNERCRFEVIPTEEDCAYEFARVTKS